IKASPATELQAVVNGQPVQPVTIPSGGDLSNPITVDLTGRLRNGRNTVQLHRNGGGQSMAVQVVESHYIPWSKSERIGTYKDLRMSVKIDKDIANSGETINYSVEVERMAFRGYGMMMAEVGLLPGCEVDRASLEKTVKESNWSLWRYDVLPDRVVFYVWPRAAATTINFAVKPRFPVHAKLAASTLYDYYNPEARVLVEPQVVTIR